MANTNCQAPWWMVLDSWYTWVDDLGLFCSRRTWVDLTAKAWLKLGHETGQWFQAEQQTYNNGEKRRESRCWNEVIAANSGSTSCWIMGFAYFFIWLHSLVKMLFVTWLCRPVPLCLFSKAPYNPSIGYIVCINSKMWALLLSEEFICYCDQM